MLENIGKCPFKSEVFKWLIVSALHHINKHPAVLMRPVKISVCSVTHQHPLQAAKIVALCPPVHHFLDADGVAQPYELLTDIYSLGETTVLAGGVQTW